MDDKTHLLLKANKYKKFARWIGDSETVQRVLALAEELKQRARAMVRPHQEMIRKRAREIWEENGRPAEGMMNSGSKPNGNCKKLRSRKFQTISKPDSTWSAMIGGSGFKYFRGLRHVTDRPLVPNDISGSGSWNLRTNPQACIGALTSPRPDAANDKGVIAPLRQLGSCAHGDKRGTAAQSGGDRARQG